MGTASCGPLWPRRRQTRRFACIFRITFPTLFPCVRQNQGADVVLQTWEDMNHIFQMFGLDSPPSAEALRMIGQVIDERVRARIAMCSR
jgi:hypothetical protein